MGLYKYLRQNWRKEGITKERLIKFRKEPVILKLNRPTRLDRARSLGYRAKQGIFVVRVKINRTKRKREKFAGGRKPIHNRRLKVVGKSYQWICEERAAKKYKNCEVLNSYYVAEDGQHKWYEIILVDVSHPSIVTDHKISWIINQKKRAIRGMTSAAKKSRRS